MQKVTALLLAAASAFVLSTHLQHPSGVHAAGLTTDRSLAGPGRTTASPEEGHPDEALQETCHVSSSLDLAYKHLPLEDLRRERDHLHEEYINLTRDAIREAVATGKYELVPGQELSVREEDTRNLVFYVAEPGNDATFRVVLPLAGNESAIEVKAWLSELGKELARREHRIEKHPHLVDAEGRLLGAEE